MVILSNQLMTAYYAILLIKIFISMPLVKRHIELKEKLDYIFYFPGH